MSSTWSSFIDPEVFGKGIEGAVDRYVAMTRATQQLVILRVFTTGQRNRPSELSRQARITSMRSAGLPSGRSTIKVSLRADY